MTKEEVLARLTAVLKESFDIPSEKVVLEARLYDDLDIDSIDAVDLMVKLRSLSDRRLRPETFRTVRTVGDVVDALHTHLTDQA